MSLTVTVLGATGSIGRSTTDLLSQHAGRFRVGALVAGKDAAALAKLALEMKPDFAALADESAGPDLAEALSGLPGDVRARVTLDDEPLFETADPPDGGETRSIRLADRRVMITARGGDVSHASSLAILAGGAILALLLGAFTWARAVSERRLLAANEAERAARRQAEMMEQSASRLAVAATVGEVGDVIVSELEAAGADIVFVWRLVAPSRLEGLAASDVPESQRGRFEEYPLELGGLVSDVMREGRVIAVTAERYDELYASIAAERARVGLESLVALPLRAASGEVIGAIFAASRRPRWASDERRPLLVGMAEQTGVALERATLFEAEREARQLAELLEENAAHLASAVTVHDVARSTVADLHRAGFGPAAIHASASRREQSPACAMALAIRMEDGLACGVFTLAFCRA